MLNREYNYYELLLLMKKTLVLGFAMLLISQFTIATTTEQSPSFFKDLKISNQLSLDDETPKEKWDSAVGSFQFEILTGRRLTEIDITIIDSIEENRHDTEVTYIQYSERIRIKILPKSVINSDYEKLDLMTTVESFELNN